MATVKDILVNKGPLVHSVHPDTSVLNAAQFMNQNKIGALLVLGGDQIVGMFTERDILRRVVAEQRVPAETLVSEVMTSEVVCCTVQTELKEARSTMKNRRIRHLPVVDDDARLLGLISIGDLNAYETHDNEVTIHLQKEYIHGRS